MDQLQRVGIYPSAISHPTTTTTERRRTQSLLNIYPYWSFRYCTRPPIFEKADNVVDLLARRLNYYSRLGVRNSVQGILLVHHNCQPYLLFLRRGPNVKLPGGRLRPGENEIQGLKRKLTRKLGCVLPQNVPDWQIGECVATWWKASFLDELTLDNRPREAKECTKFFIVHLFEGMHIAEPEYSKLVLVPLSIIPMHRQLFGTELASLPGLLQSRFRFNFMNAGVAVNEYTQP